MSYMNYTAFEEALQKSAEAAAPARSRWRLPLRARADMIVGIPSPTSNVFLRGKMAALAWSCPRICGQG